MAVGIKMAFMPLTAVVSKYMSSPKARAKAQQEANGTACGPSGAQVDAHVASTLSRAQEAIRYLAGQQDHLKSVPIASVQVDAEGRMLGLEDPDDGALQDDPATRVGVYATARPLVVATTSVTDASLIQEVAEVTYGKQTSIPLFSVPSPAAGGELVPPNQYGFTDPRVYGGTSFDLVGNGMHEPLNVIISSHSSRSILTRKGLQSYLRSLSFDKECFGLHAGGYQKGWIDARGWRDQELIYRQVYTALDHVFGTCIESLIGGNHLRAWQQQATGAWFLATSREEDANKNHMIVPNGYNTGRNQLVRQALGKAKDGRTSFMLTSYETDVVFVAGLMPQGVQRVNHNIAVDGLTAVLTVRVVEPEGWFGAKEAAVALPHELDAKQSNKARRMSLVKRFSLGSPSKSNENNKTDQSSQPIWTKLKAISHFGKAEPTSEHRGPAATAEDEQGPNSVDSASTTADVDTAATTKAQPTGLVATAVLAVSS